MDDGRHLFVVNPIDSHFVKHPPANILPPLNQITMTRVDESFVVLSRYEQKEDCGALTSMLSLRVSILSLTRNLLRMFRGLMVKVEKLFSR